ncbi:MauE/DoxX family redox-associated membrane protein [Nocardiopsis rhodophaea]|uniref:MauE/DoxX family redox-associated membrane protein n=1 Tax=Nocardiopsis rhodophaea TaxID=280238 RepID=UPI0031DD7F02
MVVETFAINVTDVASVADAADIAGAVREIQLPILTLLLLLGAVAKFADRSPRGNGPAALLPARARRRFELAQGWLEAVLAVGLLTLTALPGDIARGATAALFTVAALLLLRLRERDPELGCGCFGGLSTTPVGWRAIARALVLAAAAVSTIGLESTGVVVVAAPTATHLVAMAVEVVLIAALSPELNELAIRLFHLEPCELREVPLRRTLTRLKASDVWRANMALINEPSGEPADVWRHGCWRFVRFAGTRDNREVDVVFGVHVRGRRPAVRAAISDVASGEILAVLGEVAARSALPAPGEREIVELPDTVIPVEDPSKTAPG